jgi:hypothetical protein
MRSALLLILPLLAAPLLASSAHARGGSFTGRRGNTTSWHTSVTGNTASGSITGPRGQTISGTGTAYNRGGTVQGYTGTVTGPDGGTHSAGAIVVPGQGAAVGVPGRGAVGVAAPPN